LKVSATIRSKLRQKRKNPPFYLFLSICDVFSLSLSLSLTLSSSSLSLSHFLYLQFFFLSLSASLSALSSNTEPTRPFFKEFYAKIFFFWNNVPR
jgi:hypothetical protein